VGASQIFGYFVFFSLLNLVTFLSHFLLGKVSCLPSHGGKINSTAWNIQMHQTWQLSHVTNYIKLKIKKDIDIFKANSLLRSTKKNVLNKVLFKNMWEKEIIKKYFKTKYIKLEW